MKKRWIVYWGVVGLAVTCALAGVVLVGAYDDDTGSWSLAPGVVLLVAAALLFGVAIVTVVVWLIGRWISHRVGQVD